MSPTPGQLRQLCQDAAVLERATRQGLTHNKARLRAVFARRPLWAELALRMHSTTDFACDPFAHSRSTAGDEDDRLIHELVAQLSQQRGFGRLRCRLAWRLRSIAPWHWITAGLFAAAVLLLWSVQPQSVSNGRQLLGASRAHAQNVAPCPLDCAKPKGGVWEYGTFAWHFERRLAVTEIFQVRVYSARPDGTPGEQLDSVQVRGDTWTPGVDRTGAWPNSIVWCVSLLDEGFESSSATIRATLLSK